MIDVWSQCQVLFKTAQLKALVNLHSTEGGLGGGLSKDEVKVITGALDMETTDAQKGMTPLDKVYMLSEDAILDEDRLWDILNRGHSRIPVHRSGNRYEDGIQGS